MTKRVILFLTVLLAGFLTVLPSYLSAREINVTSYVDKTTIGLDDPLKLTVEVSGENVARVGKVELPDIDGFRVTGSSSSSSSSFSVVGGRMTSSVTRSYIYTLAAEKTGNFLIPPITLTFRGENYTTNPISITVVEGSTQPPPPVSQQFRQPDPEGETLSDNIFIVPDVPKRSIFRGEPLIVRYKIFSRYDIANLSFVSEPNFVGFWKDDIFFANRMNFQRQNYQGRMFNSMLLRTIALYPSQTGTLTVPEFSISADIIVRRRSFWDFDSTRRVNLQSNPINIEVKELPSTGRPETFTGAVGNFNLDARISDTELDVGDPVTLTLTIRGSGNFKHFAPTPLDNVPFLRVLDPEVSTESNVDGNLVRGTKTIRYPAIVTQAGDLEIAPVSFSFFNPASERYSTLRTPAFTLISNPVDTPVFFAGHSQQDILTEGFDIFHIRRQASLKNRRVITGSWGYRLLWIVLLLSVPAAYLYGNERDKLLGDRTHLRQRLARKILKKYLKAATDGVKTGDMSFYSNAANGLSNYLTDILKIPRGSTTEDIIISMRQKSYPENCLDRVKNMLSRCTEARFKPGGFDKEKINNDYQELISVINEISSVRVNLR